MGTAQEKLAEIKKKNYKAKKDLMEGISSRRIVGTATCGVSAGAREVVDALNQEIQARNLKNVKVSETGCSGRCDLEPLVQVIKDGEPPVMYYHVTPEKARRIIQQHIVNGEVIEEWTLF